MNLKDLKNHVTEATGGAEKLRAIGDILQYAVAFAAIVAISYTGSVLAAQYWTWVVIGTAVLVQLLKWGLNHTPLGKRPDGGEDSFPSGHTSGAFSGAFVFLFVFGWMWAVVPFVLAFLTGLSRQVNRRHHWRDIIAGAAVAGLMAYGFAQYLNLP